ncbi:AAA family ATPase [Archangium sp.]|uniref:AAA family ATPase n=1 Tax=Archangium sp. TaxID=1872627 RepID=UPI002D7563D0|nr:AAA family ATPase [Archangium sp.]HYO59335.1 AAA family ATPase [Archangium sp.]
MALSSFTVANYRSFLRPTTIELRPLTLLFGYNNSGKSALLRALPLLADSVGTPRGAPLNLDSSAVRGASFRDLCCQLSPRRLIDFALAWDGLEVTRHYQLSVLELPGPQAEVLPPVVSEFGTEQSPPWGTPTSLWGTWLPKHEFQTTGQALYDVHLDEKNIESYPLAFRGISPEAVVGERTVSISLRDALRELVWQLEHLRDDVHWLGAVRRVPHRSKEFRGSAPPKLLEDGTGALEVLVQDKLRGGSLLTTVSAWFEKHTRQRLDVTEVAPRYYALTLGPLASPGVRVNVIDTGEGMAQVLPVLVLGAQARQEGAHDTLITLEQPELHLHPALHAPLADFFCDIAMRPKPPRALIETHSENFLQGLQLAIVQGRLDPARVGVYWVQQLDDGSSTVDLITFDDKGLPSRWPPGVFAEDTELARRILKERRAKEGR